MAYIGNSPIIGNFQKCDALTASSTASYTLQVGGTNVVPESVNHMLVSLNGILQAPTTSFTVSGSTLTFASTLTSSDSIDFVILLGNVLDLGVPSDATVTAAKLANDIISGKTALASEPADTDEFLVSDAGTLKRIDYSLIKGGGAFTHLADFSASASSAVSIDGQFTSDYNIYKYYIYICHSASNDHFRIRFNRSASAITTSNYEFATDRISVGSVSESGQTGQTSGVLTWGGCNTTAGNSTSGIEITLYNPLSTTQYKCAVVHNCTYDGSAWSDNTVSSRLYDSTAALSGITIITSGGENITLTGKLYGIKNS